MSASITEYLSPGPITSVIQRDEIRKTLDEIRYADIVVGIASHNNARTIAHVVKAVQAGLAKYFPDRKAVLINSDGGSSDGTPEVVKEATIEDYKSILVSHRVSSFYKVVTPYHGIPGKGSAFRAIFDIAAALGAKVCAVVDADLRSITPEWMDLLIRPILEGDYDYVAPFYLRHKYDGTITNSIVYPLTRALYGKRIRQPIGGEFGVAGPLLKFYLMQDVWGTDVARFGIDIWMTTTAIANGYRICQSFLGAKIHDPKDPGADLSSMLHQVVGSVFDLMEHYYHVWKNIKESSPVPVLGFPFGVGLEPVNVNLDGMIDKFRLGAKELFSFWEAFMPKDLLDFLKKARGLSKEDFRIPDEVWTDTVYSFALACHRKVVNKAHLLKSLTPLYLGRTASFVLETRHSGAEEVEQRIENLCRCFEQKKGYLVSNWQH